MNMKRIIQKIIPAPLLNMIRAYRFQTNPYYKRINTLAVRKSGISEDGTPFVELNTGRIFYGYLPSPEQRYFYTHMLKGDIKARLQEDCINVAFDIVMRYLGPESSSDYVNQGKYYDFSTGDTVVEVGAFMGYYAMRAAELVGASGKVIAVEAVEENLRLLNKNISANAIKNITVVPKAAWKSTGTLTFYRHARQQASAISTTVNAQEEFHVACETIDNILEGLGVTHASFIRIQVNGAEREVLSGMTEILKHGPNLLIAAIYQRDGKKSWIEINAILEKNKYSTIVQGGNIFAVRQSEKNG